MTTTAIVWASGLIEFIDGDVEIPDGAMHLATGEEYREKIEARSRHGYDGSFIVPGIPEAVDEEDALEALSSFREWVITGTPGPRPNRTHRAIAAGTHPLQIAAKGGKS